MGSAEEQVQFFRSGVKVKAVDFFKSGVGNKIVYG